MGDDEIEGEECTDCWGESTCYWPDPYRQAVYNEQISVNLCDDCWTDSNQST